MSKYGIEWRECITCQRLTKGRGTSDSLDDVCTGCGTALRVQSAVLFARDCELYHLGPLLHLGTNVRLLNAGHGREYSGVVRCGQSVGSVTMQRDLTLTDPSSLCPHCLAQQFGRAEEKTKHGDQYAHRRRR